MLPPPPQAQSLAWIQLLSVSQAVGLSWKKRLPPGKFTQTAVLEQWVDDGKNLS